jgi:hypothetical protein
MRRAIGRLRARRAAPPIQVVMPTNDLDAIRTQLGGLEARQVRGLGDAELERSEFRVFSQFGEDGITQFLIQRVPIDDEVFVELGVDDYRESNTRFLLVHDNWRGLVVDGGTNHVEFLRSTGLLWRHDIDPRTAWVERDNVNELIRSAGIEGDIGLLSVDLDGNDFWIIDAIDVISPRILVAEYNSVFGPDAAVTIPYDPGFLRSERHFSWLYWGASLGAVAHVAERKGYALVGGNRAGNNAFFVRTDVLGSLPTRSVAHVWRASRFRESRDRSGQLSYVSSHGERRRLMADAPLVDVATNREGTVGELCEMDR